MIQCLWVLLNCSILLVLYLVVNDFLIELKYSAISIVFQICSMQSMVTNRQCRIVHVEMQRQFRSASVTMVPAKHRELLVTRVTEIVVVKLVFVELVWFVFHSLVLSLLPLHYSILFDSNQFQLSLKVKEQLQI